MSKVVTIKGINLYDHQRAVVDLLDQHPAGAKIVIKSSRQKGKSTLLNQILIRNAINIKGTNSVIVEPTNAGCRRQMKELISVVGDIPLIASANFQFMEIEWINGSTTSFKSAEAKDSLRGISLKKDSLLCIDEAAFISDDVYGIILPFTNVHKNTTIIVSTPLFKSGQYYEHYKLAQQGQFEHYLVNFNDYDTSALITAEQLEEAKQTLSYNMFLNEYLGEFLEERGNVFGDFSKVISNNFNRNNNVFYMGIDWGTDTNNDYTAVSIFNSQKEQTRVAYWNDADVFTTIDKIVALIREYRPAKVSVESNSIGEVNYQLLVKAINTARMSVNISKFNTNNDSKRRIIENMVALIQQGAVQFLDDAEMKLELAIYEMEKTKSGKGITYNAKSGKGNHDDLVMASAICLDMLKRPQYAYR